MGTDVKVYLTEKEIPQRWCNILPFLPEPIKPYLSPRTMKPATPEELSLLFPMELIKQEFSSEEYVEIPDAVRELYRIYRPSPLVRARRLEEALGTPARIYYKNESLSPAGSHKANTAIPQAYYNKAEGMNRLVTETGAGQWGSALALAGSLLGGMQIKVYMVRVSYQQKPYRATMMKTWGAEVVASPSDQTQVGRELLKGDSNHPGSLGIAISEAVEEVATRAARDSHYALGSVLNHVLLHQTIIGEEALKQFELLGEKPDVLVACVGGGSNFGGFTIPFAKEKILGKRDCRIVAVEPSACPTLTKGVFAFDYGDEAKMGPIAEMYTLGHDFIPSGIHAGGLRYHGDSPIVSMLKKKNVIEAVAYQQLEVFEAAKLFARTEGIIVAPETAHAVKGVIDEALKAKERKESKVISFLLSGHGLLDLGAYEAYFEGALENCSHPEARIGEALAKLPKVM
jgi:tryptophan synthase beta chain